MKSERAQRLLTLLVLAVLVLAPLAGTVAAGPDTRPPAALADSLVAYWKLDEASGVRYDELNGCGGSGCDLTDNNTVTSNTGIINSAGQFTAANSEYLSHADDADLSTGDIDFTLAGWINGAVLDNYWSVIYKGTPGVAEETDYQVYISPGTDSLIFTVGNGSSAAYANGGVISENAWHYMVAWHDSTADTINIQIDDGSVTSVSHFSGSFDSAAPFQLGVWDGLIDEFGFWKRLLSAGERTALYNGGAGCTYPFTSCEATPTPTSTATATATTFTATPTSSPTVTTTPLPTDTPTATATTTSTPTQTATPTHTPPYLTVATLDSGRVVWLERRATFGDLAVFSALIVLIALTGLRWTYQLAKELMS